MVDAMFPFTYSLRIFFEKEMGFLWDIGCFLTSLKIKIKIRQLRNRKDLTDSILIFENSSTT